MARRSVVALLLAVLATAAALVGAAPAHAAISTTDVTVRYGPFTVPRMQDGGHHSTVKLWVRKPCAGCWVTGISPDLQYADGTRAGHSTGMMLHHAVLTSAFKRDATCGSSWLGLAGQRFFASGDERSPVTLPDGQGYRVGLLDQWNLLLDLMNHTDVAQSVYLTVTYTVAAGWQRLRPVTPVWLDIDQCGDSEYTVTPEEPEATYSWVVNVPGQAAFAVGHLHHFGVLVEATNVTTGRTLCTSTPTYSILNGEPHLTGMSSCAGGLGTLSTGDVVRLRSVYEVPAPTDDVMGIMLLYVAR